MISRDPRPIPHAPEGHFAGDHCGRFLAPIDRRQMLARCANGFGMVAAAALWGGRAFGAILRNAGTPGADLPGAEIAGRTLLPHHAPRAKNVIFLYMDGGPSQVDTFDPKPRLQKESGQPFGMKIEPTQFDNIGNLLGSPWRFRPRGKSGLMISDLFPHVSRSADRLCVIRSMVSEFSEHTNANYFVHTGLGLSGRPSMGAWVSYGLGSENQNLPGFVVLNGGLIPPGGLDCFSNGFLPATHQGSIFKPSAQPVANIRPTEARPELQDRKLELLRRLDQSVLGRAGRLDSIESAIANQELAFRMQAQVPELMDLAAEPEWLKRRYGIDSPNAATRVYATQCLLARRLVQRGVRFVELTCPSCEDCDRWDQHGNLSSHHARNALAVDQPIGALLEDLAGQGLLDETLVVWSGEFGRTPFAQGSDGRDHNPFGFSMWLAGGGVRGGIAYGATDEYGYKAVENKVEIYDLHATMLHLLGIDHKRLTVRFSGRDMRLTDVHGEIIRAVVA